MELSVIPHIEQVLDMSKILSHDQIFAMMGNYYDNIIHNRLFDDSNIDFLDIMKRAKRDAELRDEFMTTAVYIYKHLDRTMIDDFAEVFVLIHRVDESAYREMARIVLEFTGRVVLPVAGSLISFCISQPTLAGALVVGAMAGKDLIRDHGFYECCRQTYTVVNATANATGATMGWCAWAARGVGNAYMYYMK